MINENNLLAQHDAMSDIFVAPLGRIAGLRSMLTGLSVVTQTYTLDKDHNREALRRAICDGFEAYFTKNKVSFDIQGIYEYNSDGGEHYQLSVTTLTPEGQTDNKTSQKNLAAFVRFTDSGRSRPSNIRFASFNLELLEFTKELMKQYAPIKEFTISNLDVIKGELSKSEQKIPPAQAKLYESFYPFIEEGAGKLIEEFYESRSNVMILTGIQGSGKSSLFRCMLNYNTEGKFFVIDNPAVYKNPDSMAVVLAYLRKEAIDTQVTVALEEIDAFVKEKDLDNVLLPRLLSTSAGIVSSNIKFVLMANVPTVGQYAESLTRDGRTFAAINFRELTPEEAAQARADFGLEPLPFDEKHALSTVLNSRVRKPKKVRTSIGFNN